MNLDHATQLAGWLMHEMRPFCERIDVAGSIRRRRPEVKDIELVAIPRWEETLSKDTLFTSLTSPVNRLHEWALAAGGIRWLKVGTKTGEPLVFRDPAPDGKFWKALVAPLPSVTTEEIKLDLFLCTATNWGSIFTIRTGSSDFSHALVTYAKKVGCRFEDGQFYRGDTLVEVREECDVFEELGLHWVPPENRFGPAQLWPKRSYTG